MAGILKDYSNDNLIYVVIILFNFSTVSIDLHDKLKVYRRNQVQEYLVWRVYEQELDWFRLVQGKYIQLTILSS